MVHVSGNVVGIGMVCVMSVRDAIVQHTRPADRVVGGPIREFAINGDAANGLGHHNPGNGGPNGEVDGRSPAASAASVRVWAMPDHLSLKKRIAFSLRIFRASRCASSSRK